MGRFIGQAIILSLFVFGVVVSFAHDDGRYAQSDLKPWFDHLASKKGLCCSSADGRTVADPDWGTEDGKYWVNVDGQKLVVPPDAVIDEPNKASTAIVWPYIDSDGKMQIRCFLKGTEG